MKNNKNSNQLNIAVVGCGVAGLTAAWLLQRKHRVTLFEKADYLGGHTHTIEIPDGPDAGTAVDTGFIVFNGRNYPLFVRLLKELGVEWRESDMSFGVHCVKSGLQYASHIPFGIFADKANLFRPKYWKLLNAIGRFNRQAKSDLSVDLGAETLGQYLARHQFPDSLQSDYLLPMGAAIWSCPVDTVRDYPAQSFLRFFENHGLLALNEAPVWHTVCGGSHAYVKAFAKQFNGEICLNAAVRQIERSNDQILISLHGSDRPAVFDRVVLATHADTSLKLLADADDKENNCLKPWKYSSSRVVLHTDKAVMPPLKNAWASWNYTREIGVDDTEPVSVSYHMNRLQGLETKDQYFVTLNRRGPIRKDRVIGEFEYTHPIYDQAAVATQSELPQLNGRRGTFFCGSYFGYGFHEDAVRSAVAVGQAFGETL